MKSTRLLGFIILTLAATRVSFATPVIVETDPLTPEEQQKQFHLPEGFEIQLVVSETEIGHPMNMSFDALGRLWITHSIEYPHPARGEGVQPRDLNEDEIGDNDPRDHYTLIEGIGPDGKPKKVTHFVDGLNIPIGNLPVITGDKQAASLVYSIPSLVLYRDTDGDGKADKSQVLFTGFGNVDTHGMCSSFTRGFDGWIYACHGFRNTSKIAKPGGEPIITLNSGNTLRFKPDGSAIEQITWGQVNPFGMTLDPWGDLYNADCHSMPVTLLLRGAYYQSFGKPHDGLGFGPDIIDHIHGSTGICGIADYDADQFPEEFRNCLYICNPVNGQVHRDKLVWTGSSPKVDSQPDFITCDDGWFRPVDVKLGPDGALYVADFYNAIIGHYEAPLKHPRRDRLRGRIWRVVYKGNSPETPNTNLAAGSVLPNLIAQSNDDLIEKLGDANFAIRLLATNLLVDRFVTPFPDAEKPAKSGDTVESLLKRLESLLTGSDDSAEAVRQRVHAAWAWDRLARSTGHAPLSVIEKLTHDKAPIVRAHAARILGEHDAREPGVGELLLPMLHDSDGRVQRCAVQALTRHPNPKQIPALLEALDAANPKDALLVHSIRMCLRDHLREDSSLASEFAKMGPQRERTLADITLGVHPSPKPLIAWLHDFTKRSASDPSIRRGERLDWVRQVSRYSSGDELAALVAESRFDAGDDVGRHVSNLRALVQGRQTGNQPLSPEMTAWGEWLAMHLFAEEGRRTASWTYRPLNGRPSQDDPFVSQPRASQDGDSASAFFCTLPKGEQRTGILRSSSFNIPASFSFWVAGHDGEPPAAIQHNNFVRLVDAASGDILQECSPPRNDTAQLVEWNLSSFAGRKGALEIQDADTGGAYAWLAVGRFSIPDLNPPENDPGQVAVALIREMRLMGLLPKLKALALSHDAPVVRPKATLAMLALEPDARSAAVLPWASDPAASDELRERVYSAVVSRDAEQLTKTLTEVLNLSTSDSQKRMAEALVTDVPGGEALLALTADGRISPRLLQQPGIQLRLKALKLANFDERLAELTKSLPPQNEQINALIADRRKAFDPNIASADRGHAVFTKRCAACHQINNEGQKIGPQLDGIGVRGLDRLLEDTLDPNRNVDAAFRSSTLALADGRVLTGLKRREEGTDLVLADQEGKEFRVPKADIEESALSPLSLMPANLGELLQPEEYADLMAFLLKQKAAAKP